MQDQAPRNAIAAIRVSTVKQGNDGDSPEAQKEQIERFASLRNITIKKFFVFLESASKDQQPMQEAIDYCKNRKNGIDLFIIKSIDRFTRGGSYSYDHLKLQLEKYSVQLVDIYGIISSQRVNTLEHLGFEYKWSVYSPTKKSEILEAERAQDEMRDIMSRMIGAQIRFTQMGYYMRQPNYGFIGDKVDTPNGKRVVLKPYPDEARHIIKIFELRCQGYDDHQIIEEVNKAGYRTRISYVRATHDRTKILKQKGGKQLELKALCRYVQNPIYAGVICEKWTNDKPVRAKFDGLVSFEVFNKANRGKIIIFEKDGQVSIYKEPPPEYLVKKGVRNPDFPYKRVVMCSMCRNPLYGSSSRGKMGNYYPAYHCSKRGHYYRIPQKEFDETIARFVRNIQILPKYTDQIVEAVLKEWDKRQLEVKKEDDLLDARIAGLKTEAQMTVEKIKVLHSDTAIKYLEEDLIKIESQIENLTRQKEAAIKKKPTDMRVIMAYVKYFLEHLDYLLLKQIDPIKKANFFGVLFDKLPTYQELVVGTQKPLQLTGVNELFRILIPHSENVVTPAGFEPAIFWMRTRYPRPLDEGAFD